jgi:hypothetical protein
MSVSLDWAVTRRGMRYPALQMALERHLTWARGFALAGDVDSTVDAIRDAHATFGELCTADDTR